MKNLTVTYITALVIIGLVIVFSQYLAQRSIATSLYDSRTINISGRQTMLSQKIAKAALGMETAKTEADFVARQQELEKSSRLWESSHNALQYGSKEMELDNVNNSRETLLLFLESEPHYEAIHSAVRNLLALAYTDPERHKKLNEYNNLIQQHEDEFLELMDRITFHYDNESAERVKLLSSTEYILLAVALILLLAEAMFIFRPVIKRIKVYTHELIEKEKSLQQALENQKKEKDKVDYLNKQAETVFSNVRQGIFLMDERFTISELYSKALENIFRTDNLAGTNFVKLLRPKLVQKDQEALESFVKQLFNPKTKEKVLKKLNPVEQIEIFHSDGKDAEIESRYLEISFSRISNKNVIHSILVNVSDETDTVLLQKQIRESEEKNKRESAQLLSILRVDPVLIRQLLIEIKSSLGEILKKYEQGKEQDFRELIRHTFTTIHNLKGNASLIDLQLLEDKFHQIEDITSLILKKEEIISKDFLKVLFEINEVNVIVDNMQQMLMKIVEVNSKLQDQSDKPISNERLRESLVKGVRKLCENAEKEVKFTFEDNDIFLPDEYLLTVKDVTIQLVRNSLAHGIEPEYERIIASKPPVGNIRLTLKKTANEISLNYQDDGRGLDLEKIGSKATALNLLSENRISMLTDQEKAELIFEQGFSTSQMVNKLSGRGQGMGLVKAIVQQFGGELSIDTRAGEYFKIAISLPLRVKPQTLKTSI